MPDFFIVKTVSNNFELSLQFFHAKMFLFTDIANAIKPLRVYLEEYANQHKIERQKDSFMKF